MSDSPTGPETAIRAWEQLTGLRVTVHDPIGSLASRLPPHRFFHGQHVCRLLKPEHTAACVRFDIDRLRVELVVHPDGLVKICHAGVVELAVPVAGHQPVDWVLMAGQWRPGRGLDGALRDDAPLHHGRWTAAVASLPRFDGDMAGPMLEGLRQLAARLRQLVPIEAAGPAGRAPMRAYIIRGWIRANHGRAIALADLARHLALSPSRTAEVVRQACGGSFIALLLSERLATAAALLRQTALPVATVARAAGFRNLANFHRAFRRRHGATPHAWRAQLAAQTATPGHA